MSAPFFVSENWQSDSLSFSDKGDQCADSKYASKSDSSLTASDAEF